MENIKYHTKEFGHFTIAFLAFTIILNNLFYFLELGNNPTSLSTCLIINLIGLITIALFYKIEITIDNRKLKMKLGIGIISKEVLLKNIVTDNLELVETSILTGVGIRFTSRGILYNVNFTPSLFIGLKKGKTFGIGIHNAKKLQKALESI